MKIFFTIIVCIVLIASALMGGCTDKFDLATVPSGGYPFAGETTYVEIDPPWSGFNQPRSILVGNDLLFYVADYGGNRVVMLNTAGQVMKTRSFLHPFAIAQDSRLDLLVSAELIQPGGDTAGAIFRVHVVRDRQGNFYGHALFEIAPVETVWIERSRLGRRFPGITVLPNNQYLAIRTGPDNSSFVDPDARVLLFNKGDTLITPLGDLVTRSGSGITDINQPTNIISFPGKRDFILTQSSEGIVYGAVWMVYQFSADFEGWLPKFDPSKPEDANIDFVRRGRFTYAAAAAVDRRKGDIFIVDSALDSVFKFDSRGRFRKESFGDRLAATERYRDGFTRPQGAVFYEKTLYIVDTGNNVVRLFRLSTDLF